MTDFPLLIGGELRPGARPLPVINPASGETFATCGAASLAQLDEAVAAAKVAFPAWSRTPVEARRKLVMQLADVLSAHAMELGALIQQETGKPIGESIGEVHGTAHFVRQLGALEVPVRTIEQSADRHVEMHRRPLGVVAAIVPWNMPLLFLGFKLPVALLTGNTVVVKTAPTTPLATLRFAALARELLPPGVLNVITDHSDLGDALTAHPDVRKVSFTGSVATGRKVMASAAGTLKRLTLELGGNDAAIVLDDADPKQVAGPIFHSAFQHAGQICFAIKRLYVPESLYDAMCYELVLLAQQQVVGDGMKPETTLGPVQNKAQFEKAKAYLADARANGRILCGGGTLPGRGYFILPTIVRDIADGTRLVDEEQFAPILPVLPYRDIDDAVARANATTYGLGASVWSPDVTRAREVAARLEAGSVWVNKHLDLPGHIPFGGAKSSGMGVEMGEDGLLEFTQMQIVNSSELPAAA